MSNVNETMNQIVSKIKDLVDTNTVVGNPITTPDGTTLIPVSKVMFGFCFGGSDGKDKADKPTFGAGSGAGVSMVPVAFIVVSNGNVRMIYIDPPTNTTLYKLFDMVPVILDKFTSGKNDPTVNS